VKVASGVQYALQTSHPLPVSQAAKNASAMLVIDVVVGVMIVSSYKVQANRVLRGHGNDITQRPRSDPVSPCR
jgi:hypothetical protein